MQENFFENFQQIEGHGIAVSNTVISIPNIVKPAYMSGIGDLVRGVFFVYLF